MVAKELDSVFKSASFLPGPAKMNDRKLCTNLCTPTCHVNVNVNVVVSETSGQ